jgi:hypothetical protein
VYPVISNQVAAKLGIHSLRSLLVESAAMNLELRLGSGMQSFGQHEDLISRLKNILDMYPDGPGILCEMLQNADDAGGNFLEPRNHISPVSTFYSITFLCFDVFIFLLSHGDVNFLGQDFVPKRLLVEPGDGGLARPLPPGPQ